MLPDWGWTSRHTDNGISVLAIAETVVASALALGVAYWTGTVWHILVAAVFAPLLMLRSEQSVADGKTAFDLYLKKRRQVLARTNSKHIWPIFNLYPMLLWTSFHIRISSTLSHLPKGVPKLPANYFEALFKSDALLNMSLVPGTLSVQTLVGQQTHYGTLGWLNFAVSVVFVGIFGGLVFVSDWVEEAGGWLAATLFTGFLFFCLPFVINVAASYIFLLFTFWLRWSVKSTAVIWLPIIYLASRMPRGAEATTLAIQEERPSGTAKLIRVTAWLALAFFLWRALIFPSSHDWWQTQDWAAPFLVFILPLGTPPTELNLWHIASGLNAILTLAAFFLVWEKHGRIGPTARPVTDGARLFYQGYFWLRGLLSIYTVACGLYFAWRATEYLRIAGVNPCLYPAMPGCS